MRISGAVCGTRVAHSRFQNTGPPDIVELNVQRRDRLGGILHEYEHTA
ncbi:hypothetical protein ABH920_006354 [Catenulispora sp. EB89]